MSEVGRRPMGVAPSESAMLNCLYNDRTKKVDVRHQVGLVQKMPVLKRLEGLLMPTLEKMKAVVMEHFGVDRAEKIAGMRFPSKPHAVVLEFMIGNDVRIRKMVKDGTVDGRIRDSAEAYVGEVPELRPGTVVTEDMIDKHFNWLFVFKAKISSPVEEDLVDDAAEAEGSSDAGDLELEALRERHQELKDAIRQDHNAITVLTEERINLVAAKDLIQGELTEFESKMKETLQVVWYILSCGIYLIVHEVHRGDIKQQLEVARVAVERLSDSLAAEIAVRFKIDTEETHELIVEREQAVREAEVPLHLRHSSYVANRANRAIVALFSDAIVKNDLLLYKKHADVLKANEAVLKGNSYAFMVQGLDRDLITGDIATFRKTFIGLRVKNYGKIGLFNGTRAVPQKVLVGNDKKVRALLSARVAKAADYANCSVEERAKFERVLDQVAYFNLEADMQVYLQALPDALVVPESTRDNTGVLITDAMITTGETLLFACLAKIEAILSGDDEVKADALARVQAARGEATDDETDTDSETESKESDD